jgi:hypothetical protein
MRAKRNSGIAAKPMNIDCSTSKVAAEECSA